MKPTKRDAVVWSVLTLGALVLVVMGVVRRSAPPPRVAPRHYAEVPAFELVNRDGSPLTLEALKGTPWIADFIFTRCAGICPFMTRQMHRVAGEVPPDAGVRLVSFTVDPEHDTPQVLDDYARRHDASWAFLTGPLDEIRSLSRDGFLLGVEAASPDDPRAEDEPIVHSNRFVLVDGSGHIRGYYDAFDELEIQRLLGDLEWLLRHDS